MKIVVACLAVLSVYLPTGRAYAQLPITGSELTQICSETVPGRYYGGDIRIGACTALISAYTAQGGLTPEGRVAILMSRAQAFDRERASAEALSDYTQVLEIQPQNQDALEGRALAAAELGQTNLAIADASKLVSGPRPIVGLTLRCWARVVGNVDLDQAELDCRAAERIAPAATEPHQSLGILRLRQSDWAGAQTEFEAAGSRDFNQFGKILARFRSGGSATDPNLLSLLASEWDIQVRFAKYGLLPEWHEPPDWTLYSHTLTSLAAGSTDERVAACLDPSNVVLQAAGCSALLRSGAIDNLQGYAEAAGRKSLALYRLSRISRIDVDVAQRIVPEEPYSLTVQALSSPYPPTAMYYVDRAIAAAPEWIYPKQVKAEIYVKMHDPVNAISVLTQLINSHSDMPELYAARGALWNDTEAYGQAIDDYSDALRLAPGYPAYLNGRCWARALGGRELQAALTDCDQAIAANPASHIFDSRGLVKLRLGDLAGALADYERAVGDGSASSLYARGLVKLKMGELGGEADIAEALAKDATAGETFTRIGLIP